MVRQDGGQREEEGEYLGLVEVHQQGDPGEFSGRPHSQCNPVRV